MWNPFRSKLAAAILGGVDKIHMKPGSKVLYLGAASGTTVSHVSDLVGPVRAIQLHKKIQAKFFGGLFVGIGRSGVRSGVLTQKWQGFA